MIERLDATVAAKSADGVVVYVGGVGFALDVSALTLRDTPAVGERVTLFTYLHVRDDALQLFGFSTEEERELFRLLIGVSKIGPKIALAVLSCRRAPELKKALGAGDVALLASVPGIGRKTAERIILELRERMGTTGPGGSLSPTDAGEGEDTKMLARSALVELGFTVLEADRLLAPLEAGMPVEDLVRLALAQR
jgi:Holliday junction DNA helicase RuvA